MTGVMILFAFMMSVVINVVGKKVNPDDKIFGDELSEGEAVSNPNKPA